VIQYLEDLTLFEFPAFYVRKSVLRLLRLAASKCRSDTVRCGV